MEYPAPSRSEISKVLVDPVAVTEKTFILPEINQNIETPNSTPATSMMPALAVPATTPDAKIDAGELHTPSPVEEIS